MAYGFAASMDNTDFAKDARTGLDSILRNCSRDIG